VGDPVQRADGSTATVVSIQVVTGTAAMWDLTVAKVHTFAVGGGEYVVHNCGDTINPNDVRFTQKSIGATHPDGHTVAGNIAELKAGTLKPENMDPIRVFRMNDEVGGLSPRGGGNPNNLVNGELYSLDNRRLFEFREAGIQDIPYREATMAEIMDLVPHMSTRNGGISIRVRGS
jgi:hypothetical protein